MPTPRYIAAHPSVLLAALAACALILAFALAAVAVQAQGQDVTTDAAATGDSPPGQPGRPQATVVTHDYVTITWAKSSDESVTHYAVLRRNRDTDAGGVFHVIQANAGLELSYTDGTVAAESRYVYRVKAVSPTGVSRWSGYVDADTPAAPEPTPEAEEPETAEVTANAAAAGDNPPDPPGRPTADIRHDSVTLTWVESPDGSVTHYAILRRDRTTTDDAGVFQVIENNAGPETSYTDSTVAAESRYVYRVKAVSPTGVSRWSGYVNADTPAAPDPASLAPSGLSAASAHGLGVALTWDAPEEDAGAVTGYEVLRAQGQAELTTLAEDTGSADTSYTDATATEPGETYAYRVMALRGGEKSQASNRTTAFIPKATEEGEPPTAERQGAANNEATGKPTISGIIAVGQILSAVTSGIMDDDGIPADAFSYQWLRVDGDTEAPIGGATTSSYMLASDDTGKQVKVRVTFTDSANFPESRTSDATPTVVTPSLIDGDFMLDIPTGPRGLCGTAATIWVSTREPDAVPEDKLFAYDRATGARHPDRDFNTLHGAGNNHPNGIWCDGETMFVVDSHDDQVYAYEMQDDPATPNVNEFASHDSAKSSSADFQSSPVGIWGNADTIWVSNFVSGISSNDIIFAYQRSNFTADSGKGYDTLNAAGNNDPFSIWSDGETMWVMDTRDDYVYAYKMSDKSRDGSKDISLGGGNDHPLGLWGDTDAAKLWVVDVVDSRLYAYELPRPATGAAITGAAITGGAQVGLPLTADTSGITDAHDIPDDVAYTYQWVRDGTDIDGITAQVYWPTTSDAGSAISVRVSFTDSAGNAETVTSDAKTVAGSASVIVPWSATLTVGYHADGELYGYSGTGTDQFGSLLPAPVTFSVADIDYTVHQLYWAGDTTEFPLKWRLDRPVPGAFTLVHGATNLLSSGDARSTTRADDTELYDWNISTNPWSAGQKVAVALRMENTAATGQPAITGTAQVGEPLTADTSNITDGNGIPADVPYRYQWSSSSDGTTYEDIDDATGAVFRPLQGELGKTLKVTVTFTDGAGFDEGPLTSDASDVIVKSPHGNVIYSAAITVEEYAASGTTFRGYNITAGAGSVAPDTFQYNGQEVSVQTIEYEVGGDLDFTTSPALGSGDFMLRLGDEAILIEDPGTTTELSFSTHSLSWSNGDAVEVRLSKNRPADGQPTITGTAQVGEPLTADTPGITDADGIPDGAYRYQWSSSDDGTTYTDIPGATGAVFRPLQTELGKTLKVAVSFTDGAEFTETVASDATAAAVASPYGNVIYSARLTVGIDTVTAGTTYGYRGPGDSAFGELEPPGIAAPNFVGTVDFLRYTGNLLRFKPDTSFPEGEYILFLDEEPFPFAGLDTDIRFTDHGLSWTEDDAVEVRISQNGPADGQPTISGIIAVGQTLSAGTSAIMDDGGIPADVSYTYQWLRVDGDMEAEIAGATASSYTLASDDTGKQVKVRVEFTDFGNSPESLTSDATPTVVAPSPIDGDFMLDMPTTPRGLCGTAATIWVSTRVDDDFPGDKLFAYDRATGARHPDLDFNTLHGAGNNNPQSIWCDGETMFVVDTHDRRVYAYKMVDDPATPDVNEFAAHDSAKGSSHFFQTELRGIWGNADTIWASNPSGGSGSAGKLLAYQRPNFTRDSGKDFSLDAAVNDQVLDFWSDGETMWGLDAVYNYVYAYKMSDQSRDESKDISLGGGNNSPQGAWADADVAKLWVVDGVDVQLYAYELPVPATGLPGISGTVRVGETLTADTSNIMDANGIPVGVTFTYQWFSSDDGDTYTEIEGETGSTYTLTDADEGKTIRVEVSFTDAAGFKETVASATITVPVNQPATGAAIMGTAQVGLALTADTSNITDPNDIPTDVTYAYQWVRDGSDIDGITAQVYWPTTSDADSAISVKVSFTDGAGYAETVTSDAVTVQGSDRVLVPWSATMTVEYHGDEGNYGYGTQNAGGNQFGSLSADTFSVAGVEYTVHGLDYSGNDIGYNLWLNQQFPSAFTLVHGAMTRLASSDATASVRSSDGIGIYEWPISTGNPWSTIGQKVAVALLVENRAATGQPAITGTPVRVGEPLTADVSGITDADDIPDDAYSYQWSSSSDGSTYTDIADATGAVFRPLQSELGKTLRVAVTFTDAAGYEEGPLTSAASAAVAASPHGNVIYSAKLTVGERDLGAGFTELGYTTDLGSLAPLTFTDEGQRNGVRSLQYFPGTSFDTPFTVTFQSELSAGDYVLRLGDEAILIEAPGTTTAFNLADPSLDWKEDDKVEVRLSKDQTATGLPAITGTARVGGTLTATKGTIADGAGTTKADAGDTGYAYAYHWVRVDSDGASNAVDISGATSNTYMPVAADVGKKVKVRVTFTDDANNPETVTSDAYPPGATIRPAGFCGRTPEVRDAILDAIPGVTDCAEVTTTHLAAITGALDLTVDGITTLVARDFDGLTALTQLRLNNNDLTTLPDGVFDGLTALTELWLYNNDLTTLPDGVFDGLTALTDLYLYNNDLTTLPDGVFDGLTALTDLYLDNNDLTTLPDGVFDGLTALTTLELDGNDLATLPDGVFDGLTALTRLELYDNGLTTLPDGVFDGLTALTELYLYNNDLTTLPDGVFDELTALTQLTLNDNDLATLPDGVFDELTALTQLTLNDNDLATLPDGVFDGLTALTLLWLHDNDLATLPDGVFDGLTALTTLWLHGNDLTTLPDGVFDGLTALTTLRLDGNPGAPFSPEAVALPDDGTVPSAGGTVTLDGSGSGGAWGTNVTYAWALTDPASGVTVTFDDAASATPEVTVPALTGGTELTFTLTVTGRPGGGSATGQAAATDTAKVTAADGTLVAVTVSFEQSTYTVAEGNDVSVKVQLSADPERTVIIPVSQSHLGGATDADYSGVPADVTFNSGDTEQTITFTAVQDTVDDDGESVKLSFGNLPAGVSDGTTIETTVSITDDDVPPNTAATGLPTITGTAQVGQALTADTSRITDADTIPANAYTYRWFSSRDGSTYDRIEGAEAATYTPVNADLNRNIRVEVIFTDGAGNAEGPLTSDATGRVSPAALAGFDLAGANNNPSGVWGNETTIWVAEDDVTPGNKVFAYNLDGDRVSELDFNLLDGADNDNPRGLWSDGVTMYVLDREDRKVYAYTMVEIPTTSATEFGQRDSSKDFTITANNDRAQGLWGNADHFWAAEDDSSLNLVFAYDRSDGGENSIVNFGSSVIHGEGIRDPRGLHSDGETMFVVDAGDEKVYALKMSDQTRDADRDIALDPANEDAEGLWYGNGVLWVADKGDDKLYRYRLSYLDENDLPVYNLPPDGMPTISGAAEVGQTLTASTSGITDVNGVPDGATYTYQWKRGAAVHAPIDGATGSTYTLTSADADHTIKVEVGFTDSDGFLELVSSEATIVVPNTNQPATGEFAITCPAQTEGSCAAQVGEPLHADTSRITDDDGIPDDATYTYQWSRSDDGSNYSVIADATGARYRPGPGALGKYLRVEVGFTDSAGFPEAVAAEIGPVSKSPFGKLIYAATLTVGEQTATGPNLFGYRYLPTPMVVEFGAIDQRRAYPGGLLRYLYHQGNILRFWHEVPTQEGDYLLFLNGDGFAYQDTDASAADPVDITGHGLGWSVDDKVEVRLSQNRPATGAAITGMVWVGQKLTAVTSDITDADGVPDSPAYTYQWSSSSDGTTYEDIDAATSSTYTLVTTDVGKTIRVTVGFTDSVGFDESVASDATAAISAQPIVPNNPATGAPAITGTAQVGEPLTADPSGIEDDDDIPGDVTYGYQWSASSDGTTYTDIADATGAVFRPLQTELGKTLRVTVTFTDGAGFTETVASDATTAVVASPYGNVIYSAKLTVGVRTTSSGGTRYGYNGLGSYVYGELDPSRFFAPPGFRTVDFLWYQGNLLRFQYSGNFPPGDYILFLDGSPFPFDGPDPDIQISDHGLSWTEDDEVEVRISQNRAAAAQPTISGTPQVGQTLTADTSGIEDDDGIPANVTYTYQWTSSDDGSTYTDIEDATGSTYFLVLADQGKTIQVEVSFTDEVGFEETVTSEATGAVAATTNNLATGQPAIRGTAQVGEPLTADTSGITDADTIDSTTYTYQWSSSDDGSDYDPIAGADGKTYRPLLADLGKTFKVAVSFQDVIGFDEGPFTSDATGAVAPSPYGNVVFSATLTVGVQTVPAGTSYGYYRLGGNPFGELDPGEFTPPGRSPLEVQYLWYIDSTLRFQPEASLPQGDYILFLDEMPFLLIEDPGSARVFNFSNHGLDWIEGDKVEVRLSQNRSATGLPTISGTAQVGQTLTADTSLIADADGIPDYSYQWFSSDDGATYTDIDGATGSTYTLRAADEGKTIRVEVSFTDSVGFKETVASLATGEVAPFTPPGPPTTLRAWTAPGRVTLSWEAPEGAPAATGYIVERILSEEYFYGMPVTLRDDPQDNEPTYVDYIDRELGTSMYYWVYSVVTHGGETFRSEPEELRVRMGPHASAYAPRNVRATKFLVTWDPPAVHVKGDGYDDVAAAMDKGDRPDDEWVTAYCIEVTDWHWRKLPPYGEEGDVRIVSNLNSDWKVAAFVEKDSVAVVKEDETVESCDDGYKEDQVERITGSDLFEHGILSVNDSPKLDTGHSVAVRMFATNDGGKVWSGHTFLVELEKNESSGGYRSTAWADVFIDRGDVDLPDLWKPSLRFVPESERSFLLQMASGMSYDLHEIDYLDLQVRTGGGEWEAHPRFDRRAVLHHVFPDEGGPYTGSYVYVEQGVLEEDCGAVDYRVRVINSSDEVSPWSDPVTPTCGAANQSVQVPPDDGDGESPTSAEAGAIIPEDDAPVWSATLTTGALGAGNGYDSAFYDPSVGSLSPATFEIDDVAYTVTMIEAAGWMYIGLDRKLPTNFKLEVDGAELDSGDASFASYSYADIYRWEDAGLVWDEGDTIEMRLFLGDGDSG